jgi:prophage antirepressor-like protein
MQINVQVFTNDVFGKIRTCQVDNQIMFVGSDVAKALGYCDPQKAIKTHVDDDDKLTRQIVVSGQGRNTIIISESGLYALVLSSKLPQAKVFKHWVTSEVLPQIRKTGGYIPTKDEHGRQLSDMEIMALALQIQQKTIEEQHKAITEMAPKAEYCDEVLESISCFTTTQIAKELSMTVHDLTRLLIERHVMYKQSGQYMLYADYARKGYAKNRTHTFHDEEGEICTRVYLVWTEEGRRMIHRICHSEEIMIPFLLTIND